MRFVDGFIQTIQPIKIPTEEHNDSADQTLPDGTLIEVQFTPAKPVFKNDERTIDDHLGWARPSGHTCEALRGEEIELAACFDGVYENSDDARTAPLWANALIRPESEGGAAIISAPALGLATSARRRPSSVNQPPARIRRLREINPPRGKNTVLR